MYILESFDKELYERDLKQNAYDDGAQNKLLSLIKIKLEKGKSIEQIADELEETVESIEKLIACMEK
jgi:predicted transcriptional regulator